MGNSCAAPVCLLCSLRFLKLSVESVTEDACFDRPSTARIEHFKKERFNDEKILTAALHYSTDSARIKYKVLTHVLIDSCTCILVRFT